MDVAADVAAAAAPATAASSSTEGHNLMSAFQPDQVNTILQENVVIINRLRENMLLGMLQASGNAQRCSSGGLRYHRRTSADGS